MSLLTSAVFVLGSLSPSSALSARNDSSQAVDYRSKSDEIPSSAHVRRKRYAIFPEGSTFTVAICVTLKMFTPDYDIFTEAVNWALTYDLPKSVADYDNDFHGSSLPIQARKKRSAFFRQIETFIDKRGFDGRACILRSLCEVTQLLPDNDGFMETIIKLIFNLRLSTCEFREFQTMVVADVLGPDPEAVRKLYAEYNMTPEGVRQDVICIRQWMAKQPHLPVIPPSKSEEINFWIEGLLRYTKNSVERSKEAVDQYFKGKLLYNNWNNIKDFRAYMHSAQFDNLYMLLLPKVTPDGCRIMLYGINSEDLSLFRLEDFFHRMAIILDIQQKAGIDFMGLRVIIYLRHATLNHLTLFDLPFLKKVFKVARKAYPIRIRHSHIIYPPGFVDVALKVIRPFLPKKIMSRVTIHKDIDSLQDVIPKENLPEDLGGTLPTLQELHEMWKNRIIDHRDWFMENKDLVSDESKRPTEEEQSNKYGKDGTFRQLSLD